MSSTIKKILILAANPKNSNPLRLDQEVREINDALKLAKNRDDFKVIQQWAVRPRDMQRAVLEFEPRIVHFSGHGIGEGGLALEDDAGQVKLVSADALAAMFELCADQVECVLLNACYSDVQAEAIAQYIPYVIGMNEAVGDRAALEFAVGFYDGLGAGRSIEYAFKAGCISIQLAGIPEHLTPVLKRRSDLASSRPVESGLVESRNLSLEMPEGQVGIDSSFYIPSSYEERCYEEVKKAGSLIRIKSPNKMGKSSLMVRVLAHAEQLGCRTLNLNLNPVNQKLFTELDQFMQWFCASVGKSLGVRVKTEDYWDDIFGANDNSTDYFEKYLLERSDQPLVVAIDNFDRVFKYPDIETDFCGLLRGWHERSRSHKLWGKLRLIIVYSQERRCCINPN